MSHLIRVIDNLSNTVLFETSLQNESAAYAFATLMEQEGLDIRIESPGLPETLIRSLKASDQTIAEYKKSLDEETSSHEDDFGCSICLPVSENVFP
jgi:hypothetical protein